MQIAAIVLHFLHCRRRLQQGTSKGTKLSGFGIY